MTPLVVVDCGNELGTVVVPAVVVVVSFLVVDFSRIVVVLFTVDPVELEAVVPAKVVVVVTAF